MRATLLVLLLACSCRDGSAAPPVNLADAEEAVRAWFAAADAGDCDRVRRLTAGDLTAEQCAAFLLDFKGYSTRLLGIEGSTVDGRDKNAVMVTAKVAFRKRRYGDEHTWILRAVRGRDGWRVVPP